MSLFRFASTLFIPLCFLASCVNSNANSFYTDEQEKLDENTCINVAQNANGKWDKQTLDQIYADVPHKDQNQKSYMHTLDRVLKVCANLITSHENLSATYIAAIPSMQALEVRIEDAYVEKEKKLFLSKTNGGKLCGQPQTDMDSSLLNFFYFPTAVPSKECLYLITKDNIPLTASQVTENGALVGASWSAIGRFIFLYNDNKTDAALVDGAAIRPGYFIYAGNYSYSSVTGPRRVYAFRRIVNPFANDMLFYDGR